jgi:beta-lactamase class D
MSPRQAACALGMLCFAAALPAAPLCTLLADPASGRVLQRSGDHCPQRYTPASTFKIALSLIGYDTGLLVDEHRPAVAYQQGTKATDPSWRTTVDPTTWIQKSVVWYSQQLTTRLGRERLQHYVTAFGYGNQDLAGNPGMNDGLTEAWLSSSLQISPLEQAAFLGKLVSRQLPVSAHAYEMSEHILYVGELAGGWQVQGKTGTGYQMKADATPDLDRQIGWFVGWASRGPQSVVFVHAISDEQRAATRAGLRARDDFMRQLPDLLAALPVPAAPRPPAPGS